MENMENSFAELSENELGEVVGGAKKKSKSTSSNLAPASVKIVNCDFVRIRDAAGGGNVIGQVKRGTICPCLGMPNKFWAQITYGTVTGYIYKDYFEAVDVE